MITQRVIKRIIAKNTTIFIKFKTVKVNCLMKTIYSLNKKVKVAIKIALVIKFKRLYY